MKRRTINFANKLALLFCMLLASGYAMAQQGADTVALAPAAADHVSFSAKFLAPYVVMAIVVGVIVYAAYKYRKNNGPRASE